MSSLKDTDFLLSRLQIIDIIRRMVMAYPHSECCQIDTFAVVDKKEDFSSSNFNKTYTDFERGTFWSRYWVNQGMDENSLKVTYPALVLEQKRFLMDDICEDKICWDWWFNIIDVPDCSDCPDECNRSIEELDYDLQIMALNIIRELQRFRYYKIVVDGEEMGLWATPEEIECRDDIEQSKACFKLTNFIETGKFNAVSSQLGTGNRARSVTFKLTICDCLLGQSESNFDYKQNQKEVKEVAQAKCSTC